MLTYTDQQNMAKKISGLTDVTSLTNFKRDINAGTARFLAKLSRPVDRQSKFTNLVAGQQYYQFPEDANKMSYVKVLFGTTLWQGLQEIGDETTWIQLNKLTQTTSVPSHFFVKGYDEVGIFPTPSTDVTNGIELIYEPKHILLTADDYTTGTISASNGSQTITGTGTVFTSKMADGTYYLQITDGSDGNWYRITGYSNATTLTIENFYQGITSPSATYRIGQCSKIPEEFQEAPVDYAMHRHFLGEGEMQKAMQFNGLWLASLKDAEDVYGMSTSNQIVMASNSLNARSFNPLTDITQDQISV